MHIRDSWILLLASPCKHPCQCYIINHQDPIINKLSSIDKSKEISCLSSEVWHGNQTVRNMQLAFVIKRVLSKKEKAKFGGRKKRAKFVSIII